jgi:hypothetical protein
MHRWPSEAIMNTNELHDDQVQRVAHQYMDEHGTADRFE